MEEFSSILVAVCMGLGLAAAAGFRVFVPLFLGGLALRFNVGDVNQWLHLFGTLAGLDAPIAGAAAESWLASTPALVTFGVATTLEVLAYKIPILDHILDAMGAPVALGAGAILASQFLVPLDGGMIPKVLAIVAGAGTAGIVHGSTAMLRVLSTKTTGGLANPVVSFLELVASTVTTIISLFLPVLALVSLILVFALLFWLAKKVRKKQPELIV